VDLLITNFHQPKSTLLALVASFAGDLEKVKRAYRWAMSREYRLFSYGHSSIWERGSTDR
jgi:S-adenosylmethionine:tRNA ribosyltransferase-isomerase